MNVHEYRFLISERSALNKLLGQTSAGNVIGRMSLERRLREVETALEAYEGFSPHKVTARLTFSGRPVSGSRGIWADFGGNAVSKFADALAQVGAGMDGSLSAKGPILNRDDYRVMITATAPGSFGFEIEEASQQPAFVGETTPVERAIAEVKNILEASVGTDEELTEAIAGANVRALHAVRDFLETVAKGEAICALTFHEDAFRFRDVAQIQRSVARLSEDNIQDDDGLTLKGKFEGFLPNSRRAEFTVSETDVDFLRGAVGTVISGRVEPEVDNFVDINAILQQQVNITVRTRRVGAGKPRYVIMGCETLP